MYVLVGFSSVQCRASILHHVNNDGVLSWILVPGKILHNNDIGCIEGLDDYCNNNLNWWKFSFKIANDFVMGIFFFTASIFGEIFLRAPPVRLARSLSTPAGKAKAKEEEMKRGAFVYHFLANETDD